jgi:hypothetical protein
MEGDVAALEVRWAGDPAKMRAVRRARLEAAS